MRLRNAIVLAVFYGRNRSLKYNLFLSLALSYGIVCCLLVLFPPTKAQEGTPIRYRTEANFLAHFASFVDWPPSAFPDSQAPVKICVFANTDFGNSILELTKDLKPHGRRIEVRSLKKTDRYGSCHILFIGREDVKRYRAILDPIRNSPVLTVGETMDFPDAGRIVNFVFGETLQIDINAGAADRAHVKIRSTLETMARRVTNMAKTDEPGQPKP
jgi:YfiR/HmsC-like